jgi:glucose/arabinose dehydrogenase
MRLAGSRHVAMLFLAVCTPGCASDPVSVTGTVGPAGGRLEFAGGQVVVDVPPGALQAAVTVTVDPAQSPPPDPLLISGTAFDFGPDGLQFAQPVTITIAYDDSEVPQGVRPQELRLAKADVGIWEELDGETYHAEPPSVSAPVTSFSVMGLVGARVVTVEVTPSEAAVAVGGSVAFLATPHDRRENALPNRNVEWASSDDAVASVDESGVVAAISAGEATVTATSEGQSGSATITVSTVPVASVEILPSSTSVTVGESVALTATVRDATGNVLAGRVVTWDTEDPGVATVDGSGVVTGVATGTVTISATSEGQVGMATVTVAAAAPPQLIVVATGLSQPLYAVAPPGDVDRLFIVEQTGAIRILEAGVLLPSPFLTIQSLSCCGERGLLSVAFHPSYDQSGLFYVDYTDTNGNTRIERFTVSADPNLADASSATLVLAVDQPAGNHNGGLLQFGPDGYLYVGLGDGGGANDQFQNGQDSTTLLGSLLRIDVDGGTPYAIPPDNPFVNDPGARPEIWAYGLRNPWRYSFDRTTSDLYIADVGQGQWEEIDVQPAAGAGGENYGWNIMEGTHCFLSASCDQTGLVLPVHEYDHSSRCSVTGGYVYRGAALPSLQGHYFYGDYCDGVVRSFRVVGGVATDHRNWSAEFGTLPGITSFGEDGGGELYVTAGSNVYQMVPGSAAMGAGRVRRP